jgi:NAD(P)-dependent dehydrogenase (short-subunit alcohol dehydrogenase family)
MVGSTRLSVASLDEVCAVFETNVFGVIAVTQAMLPLLREAPAGRIVNVSSAGGSLTINADPTGPHRAAFGIYSSSKTALNAITLAFALDPHQSQRRSPGLHRYGPQQLPGHAQRGRSRARASASRAPRRERSDGHVLERARPAPVVM